MPKKSERGALESPDTVCYAEKHKKLFWFSSLSQMFQFGTIKVRRTFKNYSGQFVWIEKKSHYNSRVSLHEAPTKNELSLQKRIGKTIEDSIVSYGRKKSLNQQRSVILTLVCLKRRIESMR